MAIASGLPIPSLFVMENIDTINAFAAGFTRRESHIIVTRGALRKLSRAELQGVIAHEFSHILNHDMSLNVQMIAVLGGYTNLAELGKSLMRGRRGGIFGAAILACGYLGLLLSKVVKAFFSRQREWLADASAVQFTRNPVGLRGALEKIDRDVLGTTLDLPRAESISHMFFANNLSGFLQNIFATHPPIEERVRALDATHYQSPIAKAALSDSSENLLDANPLMQGFAKSAFNKMPDLVRTDSLNPQKALAIILAALAQHGTDTASTTLKFIRENKWYSDSLIDFAREKTLPEVAVLAPEEVTIALQMACATLRQEKLSDRTKLVEHAFSIVGADKKVSALEVCMILILSAELLDINTLKTLSACNNANPKDDMMTFLALVSLFGATDEKDRAQEHAEKSFLRSLETLGWAPRKLPTPNSIALAAAVRALGHIRTSSRSEQRKFIEAMVGGIMLDNVCNSHEKALLRTVCLCLGCPIPTI
jgi:hypothetical protein